MLDLVHARDQLERVSGFGHVAGLEVLSPGVRETSAAPTFALLLERIVAAVVIADKCAGRLSENVERQIPAARERERVAGEALSDEGPDECLGGLRRQLERGLVDVDEEVLRDRREERCTQRLELLSGAAEEIVDGASRDGHAGALEGLLEAVVRRDHEALRDDEVRDEARAVSSLLGPSLGSGRGDDASAATACDDLTENDEAPKIPGHVDVALARLAGADAAERGPVADRALL